jgi:hypothetical protein
VNLRLARATAGRRGVADRLNSYPIRTSFAWASDAETLVPKVVRAQAQAFLEERYPTTAVPRCSASPASRPTAAPLRIRARPMRKGLSSCFAGAMRPGLPRCAGKA